VRAAANASEDRHNSLTKHFPRPGILSVSQGWYMHAALLHEIRL